MIEHLGALILHAVLVGVFVVSAEQIIYYIIRQRSKKKALQAFSNFWANLNSEKKSNLTVVKDKED